MKITNKTILNFANLQLGGKHLPVKVAFAISTNAEAIGGALKAYNEQRNAMIEKYVEKDKKGNPVIKENGTYDIKDEEAWNKEIDELLDAEAEVAVTTIKMKDLAKCDEAGFDSLNLSEISMLRFMVES